jgi:hypothetical protein
MASDEYSGFFLSGSGRLMHECYFLERSFSGVIVQSDAFPTSTAECISQFQIYWFISCERTTTASRRWEYLALDGLGVLLMRVFCNMTFICAVITAYIDELAQQFGGDTTVPPTKTSVPD